MAKLLIGARSSDVALAIFLVAITAMLLVPLPTVLLDFLLVINLSFSVILLLAGLYMPNALAMLSFPSLLLLTTLFRLGLNVASTRLILSQGDAGHVIQSFGGFLIRGEIVVGIIIFLIITIVNLIVIARGASRVSEVAARFALDALPGKQMAIDSDLRAGLINAPEAQQRRDDLRKESQLYGSMDGAMKFVQGDAIAGIFIIVTNIVGGIYMGIKSGISFSQAVHTYTTLTVGDGLVNQIPAILISICAGIVVTRVAADEHSSLGSDLQAQLFARPGTILFAGTLMIFVGLIKGMPTLPFASVGLVLFATGFMQRRRAENQMRGSSAGSQFPARTGGSAMQGSEAEESPVATVMLDAAFLLPFYSKSSDRYEIWWKEVRADFLAEMGVKLPALHFTADESADLGRFRISLGEAMIDNGVVTPDTIMVESNPDNAEVTGLAVLKECHHPIAGNTVFWAKQSAVLTRIAEAGEIRTFDVIQYIALRLAAFCSRFPQEVLSLGEVLSLEAVLEKKTPGILAQMLNRDYLTTPRLAEILQQLVREGVSIRDFRQIMEAIASYCATAGLSLVRESEFDLNDIITFVRLSRRRQLISRNLSGRHTLKVISLSEEIQALFEETPLPSSGASLNMAPEVIERLKQGFSRILEPIIKHGVLPVTLLCDSEVRFKLAGFMSCLKDAPPIVTTEELDQGLVVERVGIWQM